MKDIIVAHGVATPIAAEGARVEAVDALALIVPRLPVPAGQDAGGQPSVGSAELFTLAGMTIGTWELGVGAMFDIEVDEVFVVIAGEAIVEVLDASGLVVDRTRLRPGVVARLHAGTRTRWTVQSTLRKIYLLPE